MSLTSRFAGGAIVMAVMLMGTVRSAHAQGAWVGDPKSLSVDFAYHFIPATATVVSSDISVPDRPITDHVFTLSAEYVPIENLALELALPLESVKYTGTFPHPPPGAWDDGKLHTTLTDLRFGARYQLLDHPFALSPYAAVSIPLMNYEVNGFATGGRHLKQAHLGASIGRTLDPLLANLFLMFSYEFTFGEHYNQNAETSKIGQARSDLEAQIGYLFLDGDLSVNLAGSWRIPHGGIEFEKFPMLPAELTDFHDPILREEFIFVGGGAAYSISRKLAVGATVRFFLTGANTRDQSLYGLDLTWRAL